MKPSTFLFGLSLACFVGALAQVLTVREGDVLFMMCSVYFVGHVILREMGK